MLDRVLRLPWGEVPGRGAALAYVQELTTHAWDLATALGRADDARPRPRRARPRRRATLPPGAAARRRGPVRAAREVAADAPVYDRLVAWLGRDPQWSVVNPERDALVTGCPRRPDPDPGPFRLAELGTFGFGHLHAQPWDGVWRLAFVVDGGRGHAGVAVRQVGAEELELTIEAAPDAVDAVVRQVARIASCDHDGDAFVALGEHDPVLRRLIAAAPGLRPPLFASPYEAAVWCLLTHRRSRRQGTALRDVIAREHGVRFEIAGRELWALPEPERLLGVHAVPGLPDEQVDPDPRRGRGRPGGAAGRRPPRGDRAGRRDARPGADPGHRAVLERTDRGAGLRAGRRPAAEGAAVPLGRRAAVRTAGADERRRVPAARRELATVPDLGRRARPCRR